jgi:hypothetical protein
VAEPTADVTPVADEPRREESSPKPKKTTLSAAAGEKTEPPVRRTLLAKRGFYASAAFLGLATGFVVVGGIKLALRSPAEPTPLANILLPGLGGAAPKSAPLPPARVAKREGPEVLPAKGPAKKRVIRAPRARRSQAASARQDAALPAPAVMGSLVANTHPWSQVWVDGQDTGKHTPIIPGAPLSLTPGRHTITFVTKNGRRFDFPVEIQPGQTVRLTKKLPVMGFLIANTLPWSRVWIDGKDTGRHTPIAAGAKLSLQPGRHTVTFVTKDGQRFDFEVTIEAGKVARLVKKLKPAGE